MAQRLSTYLKNIYGEKIYRLSLQSGCSCPNRDGSIVMPDGTRSFGGCTFCSEGGSGEFAIPMGSGGLSDMSSLVTKQLEKAKEKISAKTDAKRFIAYFQSYTNTYGDVDYLTALYTEVINRDEIVALSIGTRPDCLDTSVMNMLKKLNEVKPVWIELGLQTIHEETAQKFHRGYQLNVFEEAYERLKNAGITVIVHVIFGLPGETNEQMLATISYLSSLSPTLDGIKIQNLQILKGTVMYEEFKDHPFHILTMEEYTDLVAKALTLLPEDTVVHRMTGDGPRRLLVEPLWSLDKKRVLNTMNKKCTFTFE